MQNSSLESEKTSHPTPEIGDKVRIGIKIIEGNKERVQYFTGIVISKTNVVSHITVRKSLEDTGIERVFSTNSPKIDSINIFRSSKVRRSKLYFLRNLKGKASRLRQSFKSYK
jgi:large subunit ribosomal protein L19